MSEIPMNERNIAFFPMQSVQIGMDEADNPIYDNAADAEILQKLRQLEIKDGIYTDGSTYLQVMSNDDMTVTVKAGYAHVRGVQVWVKEDVTLALATADELTDRVDRVVLRLDWVGREVTLEVKTGDTSLTRIEGQTWELGLADIAVDHLNDTVTQAEITDLRLNTTACGVVSGLMQVDTQSIFNQYMTWWEDQQDTGGYVTNSNLLDKVYPVGSIYMSVNSTDPSTLFGGTWVAWGSGRVPVGVKTSDSNFNTVEETGGEKTHLLTGAESGEKGHNHIQNAHTHQQNAHGHTLDYPVPQINNGTTYGHTTGGSFIFEDVTITVPNKTATNKNTTATNRAVSASNAVSAHNNLQPYITCYMWKRTA